MSSVPMPSQRLLAELAATFLVNAGATERRVSGVQQIFVELTKILDAWNVVLAKINQIAAELVGRLHLGGDEWDAARHIKLVAPCAHTLDIRSPASRIEFPKRSKCRVS